MTDITFSGLPTGGAQELDSGSRLGIYVLDEPLGRGGMGQVWKAFDTHGQRTVAIKLLLDDIRGNDDAIAQVRAAFQTIHALTHQHIVKTIGLIDDPLSEPYFVMDYAPGVTLSRYVRDHRDRHGPLPVARVIELLSPVAAALDYAHRKGVLHRDIKPQNILVQAADDLQILEVRLIDFGLAAEIRSTMTKHSKTKHTNKSVDNQGTLPYMSPEQLRGKRTQWDGRTDQYALAVVVYELLSGHPPFEGDDFMLRHAILDEPAEPLANQPDAVNAVLWRGLAKVRDERFESCTAFVAALDQATRVSPVTAQRVSKPAPALLSAPFSAVHITAARRQWSEYLDQPETHPLPGGSKLLLIPPGEFTMGGNMSPEALVQHFESLGYGKADAKFFNDELPSHRVKLTRPFWMAEHPVTVGEFQAFVTDTGHRTDAERGGGGWAYSVPKKEWVQQADCLWWSPGFPQTERHPVVVVSHNDAVAYCQWLSRQLGRECRLPSEAEWEFAARAGTTGFFFHGDDPEGLIKYANTADASLKKQIPDWPWVILRGNDGHPFTSPVGSFAPNPFGLRDVLGNCWEWCGDWFAADYYASSPAENPTGPSSGSSRVLRGGSWLVDAVYARCSLRNNLDPAVRNHSIGFRVIVSL